MKSCFFTGHRSYSAGKDLNTPTVLAYFLQVLIENGVTDFYSGGAFGWDEECELTVNMLKVLFYPQIKLHIILPCPPEIYSQHWKKQNKKMFMIRIKCADSVDIISDENDKDRIKKRNARLVESGDVCVCYYNKNDFRSGTGQTVRIAEKANKLIYNLRFDPQVDISDELCLK